MNFINQSVELIEQPSGAAGLYKQIERGMRNCYRSEDKITEDSWRKMLNAAIAKKHHSVLEHGTVYMRIPDEFPHSNCALHYFANPYSRVATFAGEPYTYVTTNYRVLLENGWLGDLQYQCPPTIYHKKRVTFKVTCAISVSRELNRHRCLSISESSTRYCNYSKDKFGNEVSCILPLWLKDDVDRIEIANTLALMENQYMKLIKKGYKPEEARELLALATATTVYYTGFIDEWKGVLLERSPKYGAKGVAPLMGEIADMIYDKLVENEYISKH